MKCEACGGDGLIEVGAYRGDEDDANTRPCRLCGGPRAVPNIPSGASIDKVVETLTAVGLAAASAGKSLSSLPNGVSCVTGTTREVPNAQDRAKRTANEYNERLRRENEQYQRQAEIARYESTIRSTDEIMNEFLRDKFGE